MPVNPIDPIGRSIEVVDDEKRPTQELNIFTEEVAEMAENLSEVDNTSDADKPVSTAQQTALNLKANIASPTFTGTPAAPTAAAETNTTQIATTAYVQTELGQLGTAADADIIGTVSESSGTPTGSIFEEGSNSFGSYIRFASGAQTNFTIINSTPFNVSTAVGSVYHSPDLAGTHPKAFNSVAGSGGVWRDTGTGVFLSMVVNSLTTTTVNIRVWNALSVTGRNETFVVTSHGRWFT